MCVDREEEKRDRGNKKEGAEKKANEKIYLEKGIPITYLRFLLNKY